MGPDFSLKVSFHNAPVIGAEMALVHGGVWPDVNGNDAERGRVEATAQTDSLGVAHFFATPPGRYRVDSREGLLFPVSDMEINVDVTRGPGEEVTVRWAAHSIAVRALRGKLSISTRPEASDSPLRSTEVALFDLRTSRLIESGETGEDGLYEFATVDSGLYALRVALRSKIRENESESHYLAIELDPAADEATIPELKVATSDCAGGHLYRKVDENRWEEQ